MSSGGPIAGRCGYSRRHCGASRPSRRPGAESSAAALRRRRGGTGRRSPPRTPKCPKTSFRNSFCSLPTRRRCRRAKSGDCATESRYNSSRPHLPARKKNISAEDPNAGNRSTGPGADGRSAERDSAGVETVRPLPTLRQFKGSGDGADEGQSDVKYEPLTPREIESVRILQRDLPLQPRPFEAMAKNSGVAADELLGAAKSFLKRGTLRRFCAAAARKPGFSASAMGVWIVPEDRVEEIGTKLSQHRAVSHCYLRH